MSVDQNRTLRKKKASLNLVTSTPNPSSAATSSSESFNPFTFTPSGLKRKRTKSSDLFEYLSVSEQNEESEEKADQTIKKKRYKKTSLKDKKAFTPNDTNALFYRVISDDETMKELSDYWVQLYRQDKQEAMFIIIQFFVDVTGYHTHKISECYEENGANKKKIIEHLEKNIPDIIIKYTYFLKTSSDWSLNGQAAVYEFIDNIVKVCDTHRVTRDALWEMFQFIKVMCNSKIRPLRHAGVTLGLKFGVACADILQSALNEKKNYTKIALDSATKSFQVDKALKSLANKIDVNTKLLQYLHDAVVKNCRIHDSKLDDMRVLCTKDMYKMMIVLPNVFLKTYTSILLEYLVDENKNVRLSALENLKKLITNAEFHDYLSDVIARMLSQIGKTIFDIDYNTAIYAINVLTCSLQTYHYTIARKTIDSIFKMIYNKYYPLAAAAGNFFVTYLRIVQGEIASPMVLIKNIIKFSRMPGMEKLRPLLVESLLDVTPELLSQETIIKFLLVDDEMEFDKQLILLEIFSNIIVQVVTGKAQLLRKNYRKAEIKPHQNKEIMCKLIPEFNLLIKKYWNEGNSMKYLLEILLVFVYNEPTLSQYRGYMCDIFNLLNTVFFKINCKEALGMIIKVFVLNNADQLCPLKGPVIYRLEKIIEQTTASFKNYFDQSDNEWSEQDINGFEGVLLRMSAIYKHCNMPFVWTIGLVPRLSVNIPNLNETILVCDLECGQYYLVWQLRNVLDHEHFNDDLNEKCVQLKNNSNEYLDICFKYLKTNNLPLLAIKAFECICDLHGEFNKELKFPIKSNAKLRELIYCFDDKAYETCIIKFLNENVFNLTVSDSHGQKILAKFMNAALNRMFLLTIFKEVLCYYYKFYNKYEYLFNKTLKQLSDMNTTLFLTIILSTLTSEFIKLKDNENVMRDETTDLKKLFVQFSLYIPIQQITQLVEMGIEFALKNEESLPFLDFMKYFVHRLNIKGRNIILSCIKNKTKENLQENKHVKDFIYGLKVKKVGNKYVNLPLGDDFENSRTDRRRRSNITQDENTTIDDDTD